MDASTPFRCLWVAGLILAGAGCQSSPGASTVARPQMPAETPSPPAPSAPRPARPSLGAPIVGTPANSAVQTGYTVERETRPASIRPELPAGDPRIKIVAFVGANNIVMDEEVWEAVRQRVEDYAPKVEGRDGKPQYIEDPVKKKAVYAEELRKAIERELVLDEMYLKLKAAKKAQVIDEIKEFASKAADKRVRDIKKMYKVDSEDTFNMILLSKGLTAPVIHRQIERQIMADEYIRSILREKNHGVSLGDIRDYYERHPDEFRTEDHVKWLDIFILYNKFATKRAAYDWALALRTRAAGGEDFATLSKTYDHGWSGRADGRGLGTKRGEIQPAELEPAVWSLAAGQVSGLIETPTGYHVIKVVERDYAVVKPFDDKVQTHCRRKLMLELQDVEYKRLVEKLWRAGVVKVTALP
jgi:peptidyl-prolyl cis-trans isomerase SurA